MSRLKLLLSIMPSKIIIEVAPLLEIPAKTCTLTLCFDLPIFFPILIIDIFNTTKRIILNKWKSMRGLNLFFTYFNKKWLSGDFVNWQIFNTPPGFATTNGPIESYNNTIKKFFTMRKIYNMLPALEILVEQVKFESIRERIFHSEVLPPQKLINEARKLANEENG